MGGSDDVRCDKKKNKGKMNFFTIFLACAFISMQFLRLECKGIMKTNYSYHGIGKYPAVINLICQNCGLVFEIVHSNKIYGTETLYLEPSLEEQ